MRPTSSTDARAITGSSPPIRRPCVMRRSMCMLLGLRCTCLLLPRRSASRVGNARPLGLGVLQCEVSRHMGHVRTSGTNYKRLHLEYYRGDVDASALTFREGVHFLARSVVAFVLIPKPWEPGSRREAFMAPQQVAW